ncbi:citrate synthase/methylcitrate synthase [Rhizobium skierniewicense]|uniref:citrate synthase/methylcitrate synthase n=1 Tax=Rhizobium skierniewicense TaxID=984260 RepID=UPI001FAE2239|nr:citrate synthase/methylcitrate synthase [Rhizobium skierniewicense]MCI9867165.1 citrate synthase/methylcitrate synthase [Rhizobium skierniewicense]
MQNLSKPLLLTVASDPVSPGLENVVAAETVLSHVDGAAGRLIIRGHDLDALSDWSFEAVLGLLWKGLSSGPADEREIQEALGRARCRVFQRLEKLLPNTQELSQVEALRLLLSSLADTETDDHHVLAVACVPVFAAAIIRDRAGLKPVAPRAASGHAADFLYMLHGQEGAPEKVKALNAYLVTVADHGLNASTFTARVIASTKAGMFSSVIGALCALKGPLHGGAPGPVLDMLDAIDDEANSQTWLANALANGQRLMGFGHRIYRVRDPRADVLKKAVSALREDGGRIAFAEAVEKTALELLAQKKPDRPLQTNVEFYTALVLEAVGLPRESFTNVFAAGRMAGWTAHVLEQERVGKLIRPQSRYIGPMPVAM